MSDLLANMSHENRTATEKSGDARFCKFCDAEHPLTTEFWYIGSRVVCKQRDRMRCAEYRKKNPEKRRETVRKSDLKHKDKRIAYRERTKGATSEKFKERYRNDSDFREKCIKRARLRGITHRAVLRERALVRQRERMASDPAFKIVRRLRTRLYHALRGYQKHATTMELLGCSKDDLIKHLESQFCDGMSWDNYGAGDGQWSIDHIIPLSKFDLTDLKQLAKACHYTNLQPLWHRGVGGNISKGNRC